MNKELLRTVEYCIKRNGGLHRRVNQNGEYYCNISHLNYDENFCPYLGEPVVVLKQRPDHISWKRYLKCRLVPDEDITLNTSD